MATHALATSPGAAALPSPTIPVPGAVATFRDLPTELQLHIYELIIDDETVVIPSQLLHIYQLPKVNGRAPARPKHDFDVTSKFFQAFGGDTRMRDNYCTTLMEHVTEKSAKVRVDIVDCNFNHALCLLRGLDKTPANKKTKPLLRFHLRNQTTLPTGFFKFKHRTTSALDVTPSSLHTFFKEDKKLLKSGIDLNADHKIKSSRHVEDHTAFHKFLAARSSIHFATTNVNQEALLLDTFRKHAKEMTRAPRVRPNVGFQVWASQPPVYGHVTEQRFSQMVEASRAAMLRLPPSAPPAQQALQVQQVPHPPQAPQTTQPALPTTAATGGATADSEDDEMQGGDQQNGEGDASLTAGEGSAEADAVAGAEQEDADPIEDEEGSDDDGDEEMDYGSDEEDHEDPLMAEIADMTRYSRDDD